MPLMGPVMRIDPADHANRGANRSAQTIDLMATRPMPLPTGPLRTRKEPKVPVDVALDVAAFAAAHQQRAELSPTANGAPVADISWTRQGVAQLPPPKMAAPLDDPGPFDPGDHDPLDESDNGDEDDEGVALTTLLESLLFVAAEPVDPRQLAQTLAQPLEMIELGLAELADYYQRSLRGLRVQRYNNKVQLVTAPAAAPFIEAFLNLDNTTRLSSPALETLAVIAYRQPVTRAQIEAVRGVDCAGVLRSLVQRGLVADVGRQEGVGRPILYGVTELFMQHFGLMEMGELPPLEETEADRLWAATVLEEQELDEPDPGKSQ
jgi:segregation and condensation protein B